MTRSTPLVVLSLLLAVVAVALAFGRSTLADGAAPHRIVYLYVTGQGPQAKAWYDGAPPQGVLVQSALDTFSKDGFRTVAVENAWSAATGAAAAAGLPTGTGSDGTVDSRIVIILER